MTIFYFALINIGALITALGGVFLKRLALSSPALKPADIFTILTSKDLWLGGLCYVVPIIIWAYILRSVELTKLQPMLSIVYLYTMGFAYLLLGERPSTARLLGIGIIVIGVIVVGKS